MTNRQRKKIALILLPLMVILGLSLIVLVPRALAQSGTSVSGLISLDTTWTQAGSPYTLAAPVAVNQGVTLTINPGVTVNLASYYLRVNGTLSAIGSANQRIIFNSGQIIFTTVSNGWNEQTNTGCIIQNSIINQASISASNPIKIDNTIINSQITVNSSIITNNIVTGNINCQSAIPSAGQSNAPVDSSVISNNSVIGNIVLGYVSLGAVTAPSEASSVFNNTVDGSIISGSPQGTPQIFNNTVSNGGIECDGYGSIFSNYIYGSQTGISLYTMRVFGGNLPCYATVENNIITGNSQGISISLTAVFGGGTFTPTVKNNTISGNSIGISLSGFGYNATPTIKYNNLQSNTNYTFYLGESNNVDLTYNWWGTTDQQAINQSIYDFKNDFNLGIVTFLPFLTAPNPQAPTISNPISTPTPTANPTSTPTSTPASSPITSPNPTPTVPEFPQVIVLPLLLVMLVGIIAIRRKMRSKTH